MNVGRRLFSALLFSAAAALPATQFQLGYITASALLRVPLPTLPPRGRPPSRVKRAKRTKLNLVNKTFICGENLIELWLTKLEFSFPFSQLAWQP